MKRYFFMYANDSLFVVGGFDVTQVIVGKYAWFNMWHGEMTLNELNSLGCRDKGNISSWDKLESRGWGTMHYESFTCKGKIIGHHVNEITSVSSTVFKIIVL